jgi:hypothetical protein
MTNERSNARMYEYDDGFFLNPETVADDRWLTPLWLLAGVVWLVTIAGTALGAAWSIRHMLRAA